MWSHHHTPFTELDFNFSAVACFLYTDPVCVIKSAPGYWTFYAIENSMFLFIFPRCVFIGSQLLFPLPTQLCTLARVSALASSSCPVRVAAAPSLVESRSFFQLRVVLALEFLWVPHRLEGFCPALLRVFLV